MRGMTIGLLLVMTLLGTGAGAASISDFFAALNRERARLSAAPLRLSIPLSSVAQAHAEAMARQGSSLRSERGAEERTEEEMLRAGYRAQRWIESAVSSNAPLADVVAYWRRQSAETYSEVMGRDFRDVGIGEVRFGGQTLYTLVFAVPEADYYKERTAGLKDLAAVREVLLARINAERRALGRSPLIDDHRLDDAALRHARDMLSRGYFSHQSPEGKTVRQRAEAAGYSWQAIGENIAEGQLSVAEVVKSWMESPDHRRNILDRDFTQHGLGVALGEGASGFQVVWVETFGRPRAAAGR